MLLDLPLLLFWLLCAVGVHGEDSPQVPLSDEAYTCTHPPYQIHLFSVSPLVIYITNFITPEERSHLLDITGGTFSSSLASSGSGQAGIYNTRTSQSTSVQRTPIVRCIETRALHFQGFDLPRTHLEPLQLVSYTQKQAFHYHTDWFPPEPAAADPSGNRVSSFFAYIQAQNLTGGGTNFPLLDAPRDERWCKYVDCDEEIEKGVTFRAVEGNAVFWQNLVDGGRGDERTLHAGLPVTTGNKVGMNIWTRQGVVGEDRRGADTDD